MYRLRFGGAGSTLFFCSLLLLFDTVTSFTFHHQKRIIGARRSSSARTKIEDGCGGITPSRRNTRKSRLVAPLFGNNNNNNEEEEEATVVPVEDDDLCKILLHRFQGDFDNYEQVVDDREKELVPREGGGHEHIHCTLIPISEKERLAAFYFDGIPSKIFRFRHYQLFGPYHNTTNNSYYIDMKLSTLDRNLELVLRQNHDQQLAWKNIYHEYDAHNTTKTELLEGCDVRWTWDMDPIQHKYAQEKESTQPSNKGIHAIMVYGEATVESTMMPGTKIRIMDQLSLWDDEFWIHDRGFDPTTNEYIYGNQRNIPYYLKRVTNVMTLSKQQQTQHKEIIDPSLAWTLGPSYRTEKIYEEKMEPLGGKATSKLNTAKNTTTSTAPSSDS